MYNNQYLKIKELFKDVEKSKQTIVEGLIEQACFMYVQLKDLNEIINRKRQYRKI